MGVVRIISFWRHHCKLNRVYTTHVLSARSQEGIVRQRASLQTHTPASVGHSCLRGRPFTKPSSALRYDAISQRRWRRLLGVTGPNLNRHWRASLEQYLRPPCTVKLVIHNSGKEGRICWHSKRIHRLIDQIGLRSGTLTLKLTLILFDSEESQSCLSSTLMTSRVWNVSLRGITNKREDYDNAS